MIKTGDVFAIPLPDVGHVVGHVVLGMYDPATKRRVGNSRLSERGTLLIDIYGPPTPEPDADAAQILIRGLWTDEGPLERRAKPRWNVIGTRAIDPVAVEFPEWITNYSGRARFERGEISRWLAIDTAEIDRIGCKRPFVSLAAVADICINLVGRGELLGENAILFRLDDGIDLRYHPRRAQIYALLGEDPARSYWEWATAEGLDPGRLWR